ncbi:MAG: hypothetical protein A2898_03655 [Candidatus Kerfeldbacteria bacterium RIFCSPLOWO2_01_FULL_48_11]|uniref:AAA+ ATPase domain-containing protein n=1 Tax=Candidatus Kerfeldbacteria bacterium RIFCSPLOWO2_01_FULL_48_11 TaxID=1798543 RepID=A0A1G2B6J5_9BACT|nr:MAG: putative ATPases involved in pili biogenesis, PilB-like protein s [Parcubacteria group bacterium GW2011_GWA2_48_9]KKW15223.1 MAG: putative ATPases involved in pili biogenesis, PilB-like protein s [Parcubacteria group bacterium GW2011_GWC2_49_9]OGY84605.1 MAG: hypothetical protein A2898_03655 [Candidatus Kerfeldbacteria bacterium RIFCSPLOWO2_01_FULL_48_11]HCM68048.1 type II secretion system protein GspE [Candidatus Kerfeldbacteria bacterium]
MISILSGDNKQNGLWELIERDKILTRDNFRDAEKTAKKSGRHIVEVLAEQHEKHVDKLLHIFSQYYKIPSIMLRNRIIAPYIINLIPKEIAEQHSIIIFKKLGQDVYIAVTNPENSQTVDFVKKKTGLEPKIFITSPQEITHGLKKYQNELEDEFSRIIQKSTAETLALHASPERLAEHVPIITMMNSIIERALSLRASDIHLEPTDSQVVIRFRVDGLLQQIVELPKELLRALVSRIKLMAHLKIDEHRMPQDGRFNFSFANRDIAVRTSVIPTLNGSKVVLRLLDTKEQLFHLRGLGFNGHDLHIIKKEIQRPHGIILVTGPTGSGKTTTLYTLLRMLNKEEVNICTIEDPIEYGLEGVNQMQVNTPAGLTFSSGLRSLLRQDPNILMVGEIRDADTADIALNAAMTGHLVLSTLHTNSAFLAFQRLIEMGVPPFLATSVTNLIIGQRLVRRICDGCRIPYRSMSKITETYADNLHLRENVEKLYSRKLIENRSLDSIKFTHGQGCKKCNFTGFRGRIGVYEVVTLDTDSSTSVLKDYSEKFVRTLAQSNGALTMLEDGILKVIQGATTFEEVLRAIKE